MKEEFILKQRLQELIEGAKVKAALFYTFNFDPRFFENYIMPILVPDQLFGNNTIVNNIIWRKLYKDGNVPPITVYCDQYAKSLEAGPMLNYQIIEVNMASVGKNKGNFHPKQSFILLEKEGTQSMILLSGSNNITQGGWCENKECISEIVLVQEGFFPYAFKKGLQLYVNNIISNYSNNQYSLAEDAIYSFLNKKERPSDTSIHFYNSFQGCFQDFLDTYVFTDNEIKQVEIVSPYFKNNTTLVEFFKDRNLTVKIEAPMKTEYCLLEESLYNDYANAGVRWYYPSFDSSDSRERNVHSKVYRFSGGKHVYTFIGSVNFTAPAWCGISPDNKGIYNIECGILYIEKDIKQINILKKEIKVLPAFLEVGEQGEENSFQRENAPTIQFTINWTTSCISWKAKLKTRCKLILPGAIEVELNKVKSFSLCTITNGADVLLALSRRSILEVAELVNDEKRTHYYFPNQEGFEQKPIEYRLSATDIIDAWELLGQEDETAKEWLVSRLENLTALAQDESGNILQEVSQHKSLLNEMARHLYGLIQLELYLFNDAVFKATKRHIAAHSRNINYYLTHDNVDTLVNYLKDLEKLYKDGNLLPGYYWLLLSIIKNNIYQNDGLKKFLKECFDIDEKKAFLNLMKKKIEEIEDKIRTITTSLSVDKKKLNWALENLTMYASN